MLWSILANKDNPSLLLTASNTQNALNSNLVAFVTIVAFFPTQQVKKNL